MIIFITGIILILYCLISKKKYSPYIGLSFILLVMGFQSNVQGDYYSYLYQFESLDIRTLKSEPLWGLIMKKFQGVSYPIFIFSLSLIQYFILIRSAKSYSSRSGFDILTPILFFFTFYMMLMQMKAIRQGLAVDLCVLSMLLLFVGKKWWMSFCPIIAAYFIHNSVLIFAPIVVFYFFWIRNQESRKKLDEFKKNVNSKKYLRVAIAVVLSYIMIYVYKESILDFIQSVTLNLEGVRLIGYMEDIETSEISILFVIYNAVILFLSILACEIMPYKIRFFVILTAISSLFETLFLGIGSLFRLVMFFSIYNIFVFPYTANYIKLRYGRVISIIFVFFLIGYALKTSLPWLLVAEGDRFGDYVFIFMD